MVRGVWWIHEVSVGSTSTWCQCFVTGRTGCAELGVAQGHVDELLLQEPRPALFKTWRKAENGPHGERLKLEFQILLLWQWEMCKIGWARTQQEIFGSETKTVLGRTLRCWVTSAHSIRIWTVWKWGCFYKLNDPSEGSKHGLSCVRGGSTQSLLHTTENPCFLGGGTGGIYFLQKSIIWTVGQENVYAHTRPLKKLSPVFPCFPSCH